MSHKWESPVRVNVEHPPKLYKPSQVYNRNKEQNSTCVAIISYDEETEEMVIEFQKRGTYKYFGVSASEHENFQGAGSKGIYFNLYIRDKYSYERIG